MSQTAVSEFAGKTALVTGASRGIGAAAAIGLARAGVSKVIIQYHSYEKGAQETVKTIRDAGAAAESHQADLSTMDGTRHLIAALGPDPKIDILVNNAGSLIQRCSIVDYTEDLYDKIMDLNVKSVWFLTKACIPYMLGHGEGVIINVASLAARNGGGPGAAIYATAKAAVATMTLALSREVAAKGIRVNAVSPGVIDNHFHEEFSTKEMLEGAIKATPAARMGTNEEVADLIVFLSSRASAFIHGQTIEINGGIWAP
jgi:3-oxoacyl-[acyl-carrier protein] reductase